MQVGLSQEFHTLPHSCAALAARAVCDVVRAGLARGAPAPPPPAGAVTAASGGGGPGGGGLADLDLELSALDLLVLLDPELRWWQRLCSSTHATQRMADAAAATQLAAALEAALAAWAYATAAAAAAAGHHSDGGLAVAVAAAGVRSPSHLVACAALLGGLVRANNPALLACEQPAGSRRVVGALPAVVAAPAPAPAPHVANGHSGVGTGGLSSAGVEGLPVAMAAALPQGAGAAAAGATGPASGAQAAAALPEYSEVPQYTPAQVAEQRQRLTRLLGALCGVACALADRPGLLRPGGAGHDSGTGGARGSVFVTLAADVLAAAAELGVLTWHQPMAPGAHGGTSAAVAGAAGGNGGAGGGALAALLQAMMRAASVTAAAAAAAGAAGNGGAGTGGRTRAAAAAEADAWLEAATCVLEAVAEHAELGAASSPTALPPPALSVSDALSGLLRHIAGRVRGCAGGGGGGGAAGTNSAAASAAAATAAPAWSRAVVRLAVAAAPQSPLVAAALTDLAEPLCALLTARSARRTASAAKAAAAATAAQAAGKAAAVAAAPAAAAPALAASGSSGDAAAGLAASLSLLDILSGGSSSKSVTAACPGTAATAAGRGEVGTAPPPPPPPPLQAVELDAMEELAAALVLSYCRGGAAAIAEPVAAVQPSGVLSNAGDGGGSSGTIAGLTAGAGAGACAAPCAPQPVAALPQQLQRPALLTCAARSLCRRYDTAGLVYAVPPSGSVEEELREGGAGSEAEEPEVPAAEAHPGGGLLSIRGGSGVACAATAAQRRAVAAAGGLARSCPAGQQALLAEGAWLA